jgi:hypothetical protein
MRDAAITLSVVIVGILGYFLHSISETLTNVERQLAKTAILEGQEKCAKQSAIVFKDRSLEAWPDAWYENHYNEKLKVGRSPKAQQDWKNKRLATEDKFWEQERKD